MYYRVKKKRHCCGGCYCNCYYCCPRCSSKTDCSFCQDAALLNGLSSSQFLRSDQSGTLNGNLTVNGNFIKFPTGNFTCDSSTAGTVFYDPGQGKLFLCNGTNFEEISSS
ncbi:hypothetical protein [Metabacillus iocasae]|uniref:Uncharacterized protein n=1 Tax=Priestia iocasae TaxID=2291674 RepID=A0ABS2QSA5_9BACI|nr:hypothetical protein [Metabacillus iocasae]MBM7702341.1 hypothetical protein [Metabacillus iocasae]